MGRLCAEQICASLAFVLLVVVMVFGVGDDVYIMGCCGVLVLLSIAGPVPVVAYLLCGPSEPVADPVGSDPVGSDPVVAPVSDPSVDDFGSKVNGKDHLPEPDPDLPADFEWCRIIVNGKEHFATDEWITYYDLLKFAGRPVSDEIVTITYHAPNCMAGTVTPGVSIRVVPGISFCVIDTSAA